MYAHKLKTGLHNLKLILPEIASWDFCCVNHANFQQYQYNFPDLVKFTPSYCYLYSALLSECEISKFESAESIEIDFKANLTVYWQAESQARVSSCCNCLVHPKVKVN